MRKYVPGLLAVLLALSLGCPGDPDTDYRAAIKKDLKERFKLDCSEGEQLAKDCTWDGTREVCKLECRRPDEAR
jgi:hypothetical protein